MPQQAKLIEVLNRRLADAIDLQLQSRQAYWNVKGPHFMTLRELFDKVAGGAEEYANLIAQRIVQLGGKAEGTAQTVTSRSSLDGHWLSSADGNSYIDALSRTLTDFGRHTRYASAQSTELQDADTAVIFTEIARGIDASPHKNLPLLIPLRLCLSGFRRRCPEATSVPMTSGPTTSHALYS